MNRPTLKFFASARLPSSFESLQPFRGVVWTSGSTKTHPTLTLERLRPLDNEILFILPMNGVTKRFPVPDILLVVTGRRLNMYISSYESQASQNTS